MKQFEPSKASDSECLAVFVETGRQCAFAELVRRHGPMVTATIRRVLARYDDTEDARQATFFALAKSAHKLRRTSAVAGWLHKTAYRCAVEVRREEMRQGRITERIGEAMSSMSTSRRDDPSNSVATQELEGVLDDELAKLPAKLQVTIVLCDIEGLTQREAASRLGIPIRTFKDHLAKGRKLLRVRLDRRGVTLAGLAGCLAAARDASAAMTEEVIAEITTKSALFAAGKSAAELGVASSVVETANKVLGSMTKAKMITVCVTALALVAIIAPLAAITGVSSDASAATLHHWRFEEGQFLGDAVGGATLAGTMADQVPLPADGPGSNFPSGFVGDIVNESAVKFLDQSDGLVADNTTAVTGSFTIELFTHIEHLFHPRTQSDAVFAAQVTANGAVPSQWGWAFHIEKTNADRRLSLTASDGVRIDDSVLSNISIEEQTDYYVAAAFDVENGLVTFYAKDLSNNNPLETDQVAHSFTSLNPDQFFQIGNAPNFGFGHVDGLIDEVRFSRGVVPVRKLLVNLPTGDFDGSGALDVGDIDLLTQVSARGMNPMEFDLNCDNLVNSLDVVTWVHDLFVTWIGDANLDGEFNSGDLVGVFTAGKYETAQEAVWAEGDWDADGVFGSGDLVAAFTDGGYEQGPRPAVNAVPEPASIVMLMVGLIGIAVRRRRVVA